ncbi:AI-2E family transporter [Nitriliruptor alkaliphilus]|uniref:AI-2E family transporter n=1 Tax=Nitriliruptor alkaliphilus TaxID=427918 RepID=UPI00069812C3|nr:AI-2E family transporter [Nitriliruptor alkaliphilus]
MDGSEREGPGREGSGRVERRRRERRRAEAATERSDAAARVVRAARGEDDLAPERRRLLRDARVGTLALGVAGGLLLAQIATAIGGRLQGLLSILVISLFLSFAMEPAVQWLARRGVRRGFGTWMVFLGVILAAAGMVAAMIPLIAEQVRNLVAAAPTLLDDLADLAEDALPGDSGEALGAWLTEQGRELPRQLPRMAEGLGRGVIGLGQTVLGGVFQLLTIVLIVFYLVADGPKLRARLARRLPPREQVRVLGLWELAVTKTGSYVYSRVLTAIVSTLFHLVAFTLLGLEYAAALAVYVGVVSAVIPAVGTYLAGALPIAVALASSPGLAVAVLIAITAYQQVENYLVVPKITATTLELHPAVAFVSVVAGAAVAGAPGALLALPAVAIVAALLAAAGEEYEVLEHQLLETGPAGAAQLVEDAQAEPPPS